MRFALRDERGAALGFPGVTATVHLLPALGVLGVGPAPDWLPSSDPFLRPPVLVLRMRLRDGPAVGGGKRFAAAEPMSALRRSGYGPSDGPSSYGRYYGPGGGDVPVHVPPPLYPPLRPEPPQPPVSWRGRGGAPAETTWPGEGAGGDAYYPSGGAWAEPSRAGGGHQEQPPYPGYNSNYWNSVRPRAPYPSAYPVRPELQGQSLNSYTNGAYGPPYPPGPGPNTASYSGAYYVPGYTQSNYSTEVPSTYRSPGNSPTPVSRWIYSQQDCQTEAPPLRGQVPGYPASQNPAMTLPHYPYGDGNRTVPQSGSTVRPQDDAWASGAYGMGARYPWPSAAPSVAPGNLYMSESASAWPGNSSPQPPPSPPPQQPKDSSYSYHQSGQGLSRHGFPCSVHQYESSGATNNENSDLLDSQVQYSAEPQLYGNAASDHPSNPVQSNNLPEECFTSDEGTPPSIKKIIHVLEKVQYLEQEVEEFVGKKTDKAYWLLEEMLTKELLELDSIETGGQDSVRQARKEAVCKIQAILEKLEKKGL